MSLTLRFLGTSAARPTVERGVSSLAIVREGETMLIDCGEGTQRQMMRYGITFNLGDIFFTHFHGDHFFGVIGLLRTMALQGRTEPLRLWGPRGAHRMLRRAMELGMDRIAFPVEIVELAPGEAVRRAQYAMVPYAAAHGGGALGFALIEDERRGRFNPDRARELGIPEGPLWGRIHRGEPVTLDDGRTIPPSELVGPTRPGRTVVVTGDTRPSEETIRIASGADLLIHEATFGEEESERASATDHATAREAAEVARRAGARRLVLTHFSARYSRDASDLLAEARAVFPETTLARDGMEVEVEYRPGIGNGESGIDG
ncbi:MAG TPA: ribonuclease Z [Gemmatimonadaceae bacterium]|nr:ribonuclease Z [Gemmatimonadaceae bacterium]